MGLSLPVAVTLCSLPLLLAGYISTRPYSAGYLPVPTSTQPMEVFTPRPSRPMEALTPRPSRPVGATTSRPSRPIEALTSRPSYRRIYSSGARQPPSTKTDRSNRSYRRHPYRFYSPASKSDRVGLAAAADRSDTYHTGSGDVCGDFQTIGLGAGAASLLAFLVYILLTNSLTPAVAATTARQAAAADSWLARTTVTATCAAADLLERHREGEGERWRKPDGYPVGKPAGNAAGNAAGYPAGHPAGNAAGHPAGHAAGHAAGPPDGMFDRLAGDSGDNSSRHTADSGEMSSSEDAGNFEAEEFSLRLVTSNDIATNYLSSSPLRQRHARAFAAPLRASRVSAPRESVVSVPRESRVSAPRASRVSAPRESRVSSRQFGDDCFSEMIGALAGLAGLGALSGFSLSQSAQALLTSMMTISALTTTTTTTTATTTSAAGGRESAGHETGVDLLRGMAVLAVTSDDLELTCVRRDLCRLVARGRRAGRPLATALPLASLPFSWLLSQRTGARFSDLCWVIPAAMEAGDCDRLHPGCSRQ